MRINNDDEVNLGIRVVDPVCDEKGRIDASQKFCASCKKRLECDLLKYNMEKNFPNVTDISVKALASMYFVCDDYESISIKFPITVKEINSDSSFDGSETEQTGKWLAVKINSEKHDKLYLGIYLGLLPYSIIVAYDRKAQKIQNKFYNEPAIYVPALKRIFYGSQTDWQELTKVEELDVFDKDAPFVDEARKVLAQGKQTYSMSTEEMVKMKAKELMR